MFVEIKYASKKQLDRAKKIKHIILRVEKLTSNIVPNAI